MSLLKQLLASVTIVIALILIGTLAVSIDSARRYLGAQMQTQSDNAATVLALLLSQPANQDEAARELLISALFDSSQLQAISLKQVDGEVLYEKQRDVLASDSALAPAWFRTLLPLGPATSVRNVSDGWKQVGELTVAVDDMYASNMLWRSSVRLFWLVAAAGFLWALCIAWLVASFRRALVRDVTDQLGDIETGEMRPAGRERTTELSAVAHAIDSARTRVKAVEQQMTVRIEQLEIEVNRDPVTGLANRRYFVNALMRILQGHEGPAQATGHILLLRQCDLAGLNRIMARSEVDEWLNNVTQSMKAVLASDTSIDGRLARLNGADFAVLMPASSGPQAMRLAQSLRLAVAQFSIDLRKHRPCRWALALTDYAPPMTAANVLAVLDHGLMRAESAGHDDIEYIVNDAFTGDRPADSTSLPHGADSNERGAGAWSSSSASVSGQGDWRTLIVEALEDNRLALSTVLREYRNDETLIRHEATLVLHDNHASTAPLSGYAFLPAAVRLGLTAQCDLRAVRLGLAWLGDNSGELTVRISLPSIVQSGFAGEVGSLLEGGVANGRAHRLFLEIAAYGLSSYTDEVQAFCTAVKDAGAHVGVRGLAQQPAAVIHLHRTGADYIKLEREFIEGLADSPGSLHLLVAIMKTARELGVRVLAQQVLNQATSDLLRRHGASVAVARAL